MEGFNKLRLIALLSIFSMELAVAAPPPVSPALLPSTVQPSQVSNTLSPKYRPRGTVGAPAEQLEPQPKSPLLEQAKKIKFQLNEVILEGNHVYSDQELSQFYKDKLHKTISVADLFGIVEAITNYYRNSGYILSRALLPPQRVKNGVVKIQIVEGYISSVEVIGDPKRGRYLAQKFGNHIKESRPLQLKTMEYYLLVANEVPGMSTRAVLSPSKTETAAADLSLVTQMKTFTGYASYDNYGTRYIGPQQMTGNIGINSSLISGDTLQFTYVNTTRGLELRYGDLSYNLPVGSKGSRMIVGGNQAVTNPLFVLAPSKTHGVVLNDYLLFQIPIIRDRTQSLTLQPSFYYENSSVHVGPAPALLLYNDLIRPVRFDVLYNFSDKYRGSNLIDLGLSQGLPIFGYTSSTNSPTTSRFGGHAVFTKFNLSASRLQALYERLSLYLAMKGQYSFNPLLVAEQFALGGSQMGRGYDPAEILGDRGVGGTAELRADFSPGYKYLNYFQFYVFYDAGIVWDIKRIIGTPLRQDITSVGCGTRVYFTPHISGNLMVGQPLSKQVAAEQLIGNGKDARWFFSIVAAL